MQLEPRYGTDPVIVLPARDMNSLVMTQRRRLAETLAGFTDAQWSHQSRCALWTSADVIIHLVEVNQFWTYSIRCGLAGEPSTLLTGFDPVASPARTVDRMRGQESAAVLAEFVRTNAELAAALDDVIDWSIPTEAPPGHLSACTTMHHALWDAWIHERDILLPLGLTPVLDDAEIASCLRYVAALSPAFALLSDATAVGAFALRATSPDLDLEIRVDGSVEVRDASEIWPVLMGSAVDLVEGLSLRAPLSSEVPERDRWMHDGLAVVFDA